MPDIATTRALHARATLGRPWIWPLPRLHERAPVIRNHCTGAHPYAEITYEGDEPALRFVPVFAVHDGVITFAGKVNCLDDRKPSTRYAMCLDHAGGWSTHYGDLEHMFSVSVDRFARRRKQRVRAGDVIGYASRAPLRLVFDLWRIDGEDLGPVAPADHMRDWIVLPWSDAPNTREQNNLAA